MKQTTFVVIGTLGLSWYKWGMTDVAFPILIEQTPSNQSDLLYTNVVGSMLFEGNPFADYLKGIPLFITLFEGNSLADYLI